MKVSEAKCPIPLCNLRDSFSGATRLSAKVAKSRFSTEQGPVGQDPGKIFEMRDGGFAAKTSTLLSKFCVEFASVVKDFLHGGIHLGD